MNIILNCSAWLMLKVLASRHRWRWFFVLNSVTLFWWSKVLGMSNESNRLFWRSLNEHRAFIFIGYFTRKQKPDYWYPVCSQGESWDFGASPIRIWGMVKNSNYFFLHRMFFRRRFVLQKWIIILNDSIIWNEKWQQFENFKLKKCRLFGVGKFNLSEPVEALRWS